MKCIDIENYLSDYIADELDSFNARKVELHLKDCHSCQKEADVLKATNQLLKDLPPIISSNNLDERMIQSFRKHQQEKQKPAFWTAVFGDFSISKPALAFSLVALIAFTGTAFQLGRMTSPNVELSEEQMNESSEQNPIVKIVEKRIEVPVIKTIEVPVYKEKVVNRIVYKKRENPGIIFTPRTPLPELQNATIRSKQNVELLEPLSLKNFQPVSELKIQTVARSENNEK